MMPLSKAWDIMLDEDDKGIFVDLGQPLGVVEGNTITEVLAKVAEKIESHERVAHASSDR